MAIIADWNMHGDPGTGWSIVMVIGMMLFWGSIIVLGVWAVKSTIGSRSGDDPQTILDRRLASGEITPDEYEQRRSILTGPPSAT